MIKPKSQLEKRLDALWQKVMNITVGGGVGENIGRHNERFNDYETNTMSANNYGDYNKLDGYHNTIGDGNCFACDVGCSDNTVYQGASRAFVRGHRNTVGGSSLAPLVGGENNSVNAGHGLTVGMNASVSGERGVTYGLDCQNTRSDALTGGEYAFTGSSFLLAIGYGGTVGSPKNIFTVDTSGDVTAHAYNTSSADFAEYFEWADGNPDGADRMGLLVKLSGKFIVPAHDDDFFGAVSARASVVGNAYENYWRGKYVTDVYGRIQYDKDGHALISPDFDPSCEYIPRSQRPEWDVVGLVGRVIIRDDGSCIPGEYVSARHGIGTKCYAKTPARVLERIDENHVEILIK